MTLAHEIASETITVARTAKQFERWVARAEPGAVCEYHRGATCVEGRGKDIKRVPTAEMAWALGTAILRRATIEKAVADRGLGVVELVQRRNGKDDYSYLAIRRTKAKAA